jgi:hypothetical protein
MEQCLSGGGGEQVVKKERAITDFTDFTDQADQ